MENYTLYIPLRLMSLIGREESEHVSQIDALYATKHSNYKIMYTHGINCGYTHETLRQSQVPEMRGFLKAVVSIITDASFSQSNKH